MDETLAALIHEINQPLQAICNYANACSRLMETGDRDSVSKALAWTSQISKEAMRVSEMTRRMRNSFRGINADRSLLNINNLVRHALDIFAREAGHEVSTIVLELADNLPRVEADSIQIEQVLLNLIRNAIESTEAIDAGAAPRVLIRTTHRNDNVEISVHDYGTGLSPEHIEHIFEPFFTTKPNGMGIGLALSRKIVQNHGGSIWSTQNGGRGTTMHVSLPVTRDLALLPTDSNVSSLSQRQPAA